MCTLVVSLRPGDNWPLLLAANRDEMRDRPALTPSRHWEDRPEVTAGLDQVGAGSWLGVNDHGLMATVMNREGSLGPVAGKRTRGELVLEALDHAEATEAARALADLNPDAYRPFNLFLGDACAAFWLRHKGGAAGPGRIEVFEVPAGLHMLSAGELDDDSQPRIRTYLPLFCAAPVPDAEHGDWKTWSSLLGSRSYPESGGPNAAMNLDLPNGFGTVSSALIGLPAHSRLGVKPIWLHAGGPPDRTAFMPVSL